MAAPTRLDIVPLFRPTGNSPPVYLSQYLGREEAAKILSLGCGDIRNILFTAYCERKHDRPLDITCCDVEKLVIARDIFLLSILVDSEPCSEIEGAVFMIFSDMVLDEAVFQIFRKHGKKLRQRAKSLERWHNSIYGKVIRFCDSESLDQVREVWECYSKGHASDFTQFEAMVKGAREVGKAKGVSAELLMAAAPLSTGLNTVLETLRENYWEFGGLGIKTQNEVQEGRPWNPTFGCTAAHTVLNPSICPLEGFHLALEHDYFKKASPLCKPGTQTCGMFPYLSTVLLQFLAWSNAFRQGCLEGRITLRFAVGDALAFCYALRDLNPRTPQPASNEAPRGRLKMQSMDLDGPDYAPEIGFEPKASESNGTAAGTGDKGPKAKINAPELSSKAPLRFNAIDTGNLADKCGSMNIMLATAPLLDWSLSSTLVTEASLTEDPNHEGVLIGLLPGDFDTVAVLMGLIPVEYWCNATSASPVWRNFSLAAQRLLREHPKVKARICWKGCIANDVVLDGGGRFTGLCMSANDLASSLHILYTDMFGQGKSTLHRQGKEGPPSSQHTQATFAALLERIKHTTFTGWEAFAKTFLGLFDEAEKSTGRGYFSELLVQLHRFSVLDFADSQRLLGQPFANSSLVHVTLRVPRWVFNRFEGINLSKLDLRVVCTIWHSESMIMDFGVLRMAFGSIQESGHVFGRRSSHLVIEEDQDGWLGFSPLLATFCAPSSAFSEPYLMVAFRLEQDSQTAEVLEPILGPSLVIFETSLDDDDDDDNVFVCSEPPVLHSPEEITVQGHDRVLPRDFPSPRPQTPRHPFPQLSSCAGDSIASTPVQDQKSPVAARKSAPAEDREAPLAAGALRNGCDTASTGSASKELPDEQPQQQHDPASTGSASKELACQQSQQQLFCVRIFVIMNEMGSMGAMSAQLILTSEEWKAKFSNGAKVTTKLVSPCGLAVCMEGCEAVGYIFFPVPIIRKGFMVSKYAESATVLVTVMPGDPNDKRYVPILMWSSFVVDGTIVVTGLPTLALDSLPAFDRSSIGFVDGLNSLIHHILSFNEDNATEEVEQRDPRIGFKHVLMELFKCTTGSLGRPLKTFFVFIDEGNNERFVLCISAVRFDLAGQSIVLDAAIVTVTPRNKTRVKMMFGNPCLNKSGPDSDEVRILCIPSREIPLWKKMLAGAVERARTWSHQDCCKYKKIGRIPVVFDANQEFLCSCGHGQLPDYFYEGSAPGWDRLKETAVRAAISPCFASMLVEPQRMNPLLAECAGRKLGDADCFNCRKTKEQLGGTEMSKCARCGVAKYCSRECQKEAWKMHKVMCGFYVGFGNDDRAR